jgi:hypothetical protein
MWTIERARTENLPDIQANIKGKLYPARIMGRQLHWATVSADTPLGFINAEFAWQTIVNILNGSKVAQF